MSKDRRTFFNLSVNKDGRVSLWDTMDSAIRGKENGEVNLRLELTAHQESLIARATLLAQSKQDGL